MPQPVASWLRYSLCTQVGRYRSDAERERRCTEYTQDLYRQISYVYDTV